MNGERRREKREEGRRCYMNENVLNGLLDGINPTLHINLIISREVEGTVRGLEGKGEGSVSLYSA